MDLLKLSATYKSYHITETGEYEVIFSFPRQLNTALMTGLDRIKECQKPIILSVKKETKKRSLDANDYMWKLCRKLSEVLNLTVEEIYRQNVIGYGPGYYLPLKNEDVEEFVNTWESRGIAWCVEIIDDSKLKGYKKVFAYKGSSTYNSLEMWNLIKRIQQDCEAQGIDTMPPDELKSLLEGWEK